MNLMDSTKQLEYLTDKDWTLVLHKAQTLTFRPGEEIIRQGSQSGMIYFIREGSVRATTAGGTSDIATLGPDDICGEMAFLENGAATAAVIAKELKNR
jgi:CRP-like cAMP-binding protein